MNKKIRLEIKFYSGIRQSLPVFGNYMPHLVVKNGEYLGVKFVEGKARFDEFADAAAELLYNVNYSPLAEDAAFKIMEGGGCVGKGVVIETFSV